MNKTYKDYMSKTYKDYLNEILSSPLSDSLTGEQHTALDAVIELLNYCDYSKLCELAIAEKNNRCILLPEDGMLYYLEESVDGSEKWVANKPIKNIYFQIGWGIASLSYSISEIGNKAFFKRKDAVDALNKLINPNSLEI